MEITARPARGFIRTALVAAALCSGALLAGFITLWQPGLSVVGVTLTLLPIVVALYFSRPRWALITFVLLLPLHSFLITLLIAQVGLSLSLGRAIAAWKELLLVGTFFAVIVQALVRGRIPRPVWLDAIAAAWLGLVLLHFGFSLVFRPAVPVVALAYGARDWMLYLLPYFVGRLVVFNERYFEKVLTAIAAIGVLTSAFGIVEYFFIPTSWWISFGVPYYFGTFLGLVYPDYLGGLPPNFWAEVAGNAVRRAVSTHLSGQGFALPFLIILPVVLCRYLRRPAWANLAWVGICGVGLLLSITRMTIIACGIQVVLLLWLYPRRSWLLIAMALVGMLLLGGLVGNSRFREFVVDTVTLSDTSGGARPAQWAVGLRDLVTYPLGRGLGFSGQVGARFGQGGVGSEAGYFKITGDLGLPGLLLFLAWFSGVLFYAWRLIHRREGAWRQLGLIGFVAAVGFLVNNLTAPPDQSPFTIYVFAWLAGLTVRVAAASPFVPTPQAEPAPILPLLVRADEAAGSAALLRS